MSDPELTDLSEHGTSSALFARKLVSSYWRGLRPAEAKARQAAVQKLTDAYRSMSITQLVSLIPAGSGDLAGTNALLCNSIIDSLTKMPQEELQSLAASLASGPAKTLADSRNQASANSKLRKRSGNALVPL